MVIDAPSPVPPDPLVRRLTIDDFDTVYPASVAMFTEEVGVSPEADGAGYYRARVAQLLSRGWSFARIENGRVLFKAEVGLATPQVCQVQGVYVDPQARGQGLAAPGMAAVIEMALADIAPVVSLYVNAGNVAAKAAYRRAGFVQTATFATVLF
jgi:predicted GNAT family acetyltransferase